MLFRRKDSWPTVPDADLTGKVRKRIYFSGRVQGVGFRFTAQGLAKTLGLTGYVKNLYDGRVEMEVQGTERAIADMLSELNNDTYIRISSTEIIEKPVIPETRFTMLY